MQLQKMRYDSNYLPYFPFFETIRTKVIGFCAISSTNTYGKRLEEAMSKLKKIVKKNLFTIITLTISMIILLIFLFQGNSIQQLGSIFQSLSVSWILLAFGTLFATWLIEGFVDWILCRHLYPDWSFGRAFMIGMTGLFYSAITPFSTGGQPMQIYYMAKMGIKPGHSAAVISVKTITYQITMVVFSLFLISSELHFFVQNVSNLTFLTIFGIVSNIIFILAVVLVSVNAGFIYRLLHNILNLLGKIHLVKEPEKKYESIITHLDTFHAGFKTMGHNWKLYIAVCLLTVVQIVISSSVTYCIYRAFHLNEASLWVMIAAQVFSNMVASFVPLPGGSGGAEVSFSAFCHVFFKNLLTPALLVWRLLTYYGSILFGCIFVAIGARKYVGAPPPENYSNPDKESKVEKKSA